MRRRTISAALLSAFIALAVAVAGVEMWPPLQWRAQLVGLKLLGRLSEIGWMEMIRMAKPGSLYDIRDLARTKNVYVTLRNPYWSEADVAAGRAAFQSSCSACHGLDGTGSTGPDLTAGSLRHGESDWGLFRTISRGISGTPMQAHALTERQTWQLVEFVKRLRSGTDNRAPSTAGRRPLLSAPVTYERLARATAEPGNWLTYSATYNSQRYSALAQISHENVARLRVLWIYQSKAREESLKFETTPLVVDSTMFLTEPPNTLVALNAETGEELWTYRRALPERLPICCGRVNRGLAILDNTLYLGTLDAHLVALDATTGRVRWDVPVANSAEGFSITAAPLAVHDLIIVGVSGGEFGVRGFIDAYEAASGKRRWRFNTIPQPGEPGNETWSGRSWQTGGGPTWITGSFDPGLDLIYWGVGNPSPEFNGDVRLGDNLYTNSVVALRAKTGTLAWYFQFTPHDEHDWDSNQVPVLVDRDSAGRRQKLMLWANRNAFYYVLDRETGRFLSARAFAEQNWADGIDSTGRPMVRPNSGPSREGTLTLPGGAGANWSSPTYSPRTGLFYVTAMDCGHIFFKSVEDYSPGETFTGGRGGAAVGPSVAAVRALDAFTGVRRWEYVFPGSCYGSIGGLLSTAGDLVFAGYRSTFVALHSVTGQPLWSINTGGAIHAAPVTYMVGGNQQLSVAAGGAVITFGLR
jgi:alcohol dehydrogenase (cytochrome c)